MIKVMEGDYLRGYQACLKDVDQALTNSLNKFNNTPYGIAQAMNMFIDYLHDTRVALKPPAESMTMEDLIAIVSRLNGYSTTANTNGDIVIVVKQ